MSSSGGGPSAAAFLCAMGIAALACATAPIVIDHIGRRCADLEGERGLRLTAGCPKETVVFGP